MADILPRRRFRVRKQAQLSLAWSPSYLPAARVSRGSQMSIAITVDCRQGYCRSERRRKEEQKTSGRRAWALFKSHQQHLGTDLGASGGSELLFPLYRPSFGANNLFIRRLRKNALLGPIRLCAFCVWLATSFLSGSPTGRRFRSTFSPRFFALISPL